MRLYQPPLKSRSDTGPDDAGRRPSPVDVIDTQKLTLLLGERKDALSLVMLSVALVSARYRESAEQSRIQVSDGVKNVKIKDFKTVLMQKPLYFMGFYTDYARAFVPYTQGVRTQCLSKLQSLDALVSRYTQAGWSPSVQKGELSTPLTPVDVQLVTSQGTMQSYFTGTGTGTSVRADTVIRVMKDCSAVYVDHDAVWATMNESAMAALEASAATVRLRLTQAGELNALNGFLSQNPGPRLELIRACTSMCAWLNHFAQVIAQWKVYMACFNDLTSKLVHFQK